MLKGQDKSSEIRVAVAANVQFAMQEIKAGFEKETGIKIETILGSSGQLTAQITQGAPYDIFISADMKYPFTLFTNKLAIEKPKVYARGSLVLWTMNQNIKVDKILKQLFDKKIEKIAIANPKAAPYGVAAVHALKYFGIYDKIKDKLVYGESIAQVNQFIVSKTADIGFTSKSVVISPNMKGKGVWEEIDTSAYDPIEQGFVILKYGYDNHRKEAQAFYDFMFSQKAIKILKKYGYKIGGDK
jgi:molybdate transport system substrate-binding protein